MRRLGILAILAVAGGVGCSNLTEADGIAGLEIRVPKPAVVEVGQTIVLKAIALDRNGDSVAAPVTWVAADPTVSVTSDGQLTGVVGGSQGRVQAQSGAIVSDFVTFTVSFRPDTIELTGDSALTVPAGATQSAPLVAALLTLHPGPQPLSGRALVYEVTSPTFADPSQRTVELPGGVLGLSATTGADGTPTAPVTLSRVAGEPSPPTAVVSVRAVTAAGATVPGSGQRFVIQFE